MRLITIVNRYGNLTAVEGKVKGARVMWRVPDQLEVYCSGAMKKIVFEQAGNLALNIALDMHIPAVQLRRVAEASHERSVERKYSRRMF